jgi:bacterioferritin-associated ferredoxin
MIICHCLNLTDRDIRAGITPSVKSPGTSCCGSCRQTIESMMSRNDESAHPNGR